MSEPVGHPEMCRHFPPAIVMENLRDKIMKYGGISKVARETGYSREGLSKALRSNGRMRFNMFWDVTKLVDFHWCIGVRQSYPKGAPHDRQKVSVVL